MLTSNGDSLEVRATGWRAAGLSVATSSARELLLAVLVLVLTAVLARASGLRAAGLPVATSSARELLRPVLVLVLVLTAVSVLAPVRAASGSRFCKQRTTRGQSASQSVSYVQSVSRSARWLLTAVLVLVLVHMPADKAPHALRYQVRYARLIRRLATHSQSVS